jgi:hypothetical protein
MPDRTDPHYGACLLPRTVIIDQAPRPRVRSGPRSQSSTTNKNSWGLPDGGLAALHVAACNAMRAPSDEASGGYRVPAPYGHDLYGARA